MAFIHSFDTRYTALVRSLPVEYTPLLRHLTIIGEPAVVSVIGVGGFLSAVQYKETAVERAFIYGLIAYCLNTLIKFALHRPRPKGLIVQTLGVPSYSLPSGHAFGSVIFYGLYAYLAIRFLAQPLDIIVAAAIAAIIVLIGISRVYFGAHYPSDVVAGWILGLISLWAMIVLTF